METLNKQSGNELLERVLDDIVAGRHDELRSALDEVHSAEVAIGLVVDVAQARNTVVAVSLGGTVPLLLKRMKVDPAAASGPILTTVTDMCGFFLVLSLASLMLPRLTGI